MTDPCVALCLPIADQIHPYHMRSYRSLDKKYLKHTFDLVGWPVDQARNEITYAALSEKDITHLFWIDNDMVFPPNALQRLLSHKKPFVGGLCFDRRHPYKPVLGRIFDPSYGYESGSIGWMYDYPPDALLDVDFTGGAFLLIERGVFEDIERTSTVDGKWPEKMVGQKEYKNWWTPLPENGSSEDLAFCSRARRAGHRVTVDTGLKIGHVGEVVVDEGFVKRNRVFSYHQYHAPLETLIDAVGTTPNTDIIDDIENKMPLVTVVIPTYNQKRAFLDAAIKSALAQTVPVEIIVVDDGSQELPFFDHSLVQIIRHEKNKGISEALNTGIKNMTTNWFCWLSSDDLFEPLKVELQLTALLNSRMLVGFTGYNLKLDNANSIIHVNTPTWTTRKQQNEILQQRCCINGSTIMIHRSVFEKVGLFDPSFKYSQDWEMFRRIGFSYDIFFQPDKLTTRREFGDNLSKKIIRDETMRSVRDEEDRRVREMEDK